MFFGLSILNIGIIYSANVVENQLVNRIEVVENYDHDSRNYTITLKQSCPSTPDQEVKEPFHMPFAIGLLDSAGQEIILDDKCITAG